MQVNKDLVVRELEHGAFLLNELISELNDVKGEPPEGCEIAVELIIIMQSLNRAWNYRYMSDKEYNETTEEEDLGAANTFPNYLGQMMISQQAQTH